VRHHRLLVLALTASCVCVAEGAVAATPASPLTRLRSLTAETARVDSTMAVRNADVEAAHTVVAGGVRDSSALQDSVARELIRIAREFHRADSVRSALEQQKSDTPAQPPTVVVKVPCK